MKEKNFNKNKIIVILGPTASGKSGTAIRLAKKFNGEVLSADSRQIYRGMDIGTGKILQDTRHKIHSPNKFIKSDSKNQKIKPYFSEGIAHYGIDIVSPRTDYSVAKFKKYADRVIADIIRREKVPIIAGGTGFWIKAIVDDVNYPEVAPDPVLRNMLRSKTTEELFSMLEELDPERAESIDAKNPVRLIRAIEICKAIGKVPKISQRSTVRSPRHEFLQIGILRNKEELNERIRLNVKKRFAAGMISEVERLHEEGLSWKKMESFGLSYRLIPEYLKKKDMTEEELVEKIYLAEKDYAKRQMTWFSAQDRSASGGKKDKRIVWLKNYEEIETAVKKFLS